MGSQSTARLLIDGVDQGRLPSGHGLWQAVWMEVRGGRMMGKALQEGGAA